MGRHLTGVTFLVAENDVDVRICRALGNLVLI